MDVAICYKDNNNHEVFSISCMHSSHANVYLATHYGAGSAMKLVNKESESVFSFFPLRT